MIELVQDSLKLCIEMDRKKIQTSTGIKEITDYEELKVFWENRCIRIWFLFLTGGMIPPVIPLVISMVDKIADVAGNGYVAIWYLVSNNFSKRRPNQ